MIESDTRGSAFGGAILLMATLTIVVLTAAMFFGDVGMDSEQAEMPEPDVEYDYVANPDGNEALYIRHSGGARVNPNQMAVEISGAACTGEGEPDGTYAATDDFGLAEDNWLSPGMALVIDDDNPTRMCESGDFRLDGATVKLVWESPEEEQSVFDSWEP